MAAFLCPHLGAQSTNPNLWHWSAGPCRWLCLSLFASLCVPCAQAVHVDIEGVRATLCGERGGPSTSAFLQGFRLRAVSRPFDSMARVAIRSVGVQCLSGATTTSLLESHSATTESSTFAEAIVNMAQVGSPRYACFLVKPCRLCFCMCVCVCVCVCVCALGVVSFIRVHVMVSVV